MEHIKDVYLVRWHLCFLTGFQHTCYEQLVDTTYKYILKQHKDRWLHSRKDFTGMSLHR